MECIMSETRSPSLEQSTPNVENQLLTEIFNSDLEAASAMLKQHPELLSQASSIGEHQQVRPLELARELRDIGFYEMLLASNRDPNNVKPHAIAELKAPLDIKYFTLVAEAIMSAGIETVFQELGRHRHPDEYQQTELGRAMDAFREACDKHGETTMQDVINAFKVLSQSWGGFTWNQAKLFFLQVVGYVERLEPVWFRQALHQGTKNLLKPDVELQRVSECKVNNVTHSLINHVPRKGLGFEFAFDDTGVVAITEKSGKRFLWHTEGHLGSFWSAFPCTIEKFCRAVESRFNQLENACSQ